jgi:hypothetical protein
MLSLQEIESRFGSHKATIEGPEATLPKHTDLRAAWKDFVAFLDRTLPDGRYKDLLHDDLERASMWSHKAIAELAPVVSEANTVVQELNQPDPAAVQEPLPLQVPPVVVLNPSPAVDVPPTDPPAAA